MEVRTTTESEERKFVGEHTRYNAGWTLNAVRRFFNPNLKYNDGIRQLVDKMLKSNLLDAEDLELILKMKSYSEVSTHRPLYRKAIFESTLAILPCVISLLTKHMKTYGKWISSASLLVVIFRWHGVILEAVDQKKMKRLLEASDKLDNSMKKSLKAIAFCDSVNLGYQMKNEVSQIRNLEAMEIKELGMRSRCILPGLRITLHKCSTRVAAELSRVASKLKAEGPLTSNFVDESFIISDVYDEILDDDSMWFKCMDGRGGNINVPTVQNLKGAVDIFNLKRSSYFKLVVLCALAKQSTSEIDHVHTLYRVVMDATQEIDKALLLHKGYVINPIAGIHLCEEYNIQGLDFSKPMKTCGLHLQVVNFNLWKLEDFLFPVISNPSQNMEEFSGISSRLMYNLSFAKQCIKQSKSLNCLFDSSLSAKFDNESTLLEEDDQEFSTKKELSFNDFITKEEIYKLYFGNDSPNKLSEGK